MLNFILPILKNPLTRMIGSKVIDGINHKMEKDKIIRAKEIEAVKTVSVEQVRQQEHSIKDEILRNAPQEFWWAILIVYSGSFGMSTLNKVRKKK